jgi:hypothetical protein
MSSGQQAGWALGHPGDLGDGGQLGQQLSGGVAAADDDHALAAQRLGAAVAGGVQVLAAEVAQAGIVRDVGAPPGAGRADHALGLPGALAGLDQQVVVAAPHRVHRHWAQHRQLVAAFVVGQVGDDRGGARVATAGRDGHHAAG